MRNTPEALNAIQNLFSIKCNRFRNIKYIQYLSRNSLFETRKQSALFNAQWQESLGKTASRIVSFQLAAIRRKVELF